MLSVTKCMVVGWRPLILRRAACDFVNPAHCSNVNTPLVVAVAFQ